MLCPGLWPTTRSVQLRFHTFRSRLPWEPWRAQGLAVGLAVGLCLASFGVAWASEAGLRPVVKACGHHAYPPWNWQRGDQIVGTCADLAREALRAVGYDIDLRFVGPWPRCQKLVESGQVDVNICALDSTARRAYSTPVFPAMAANPIGLFFRADRPGPVVRSEELKGLRVAVVRGVSFGDTLDTHLRQHAQIQTTSNDRQSFSMLLLGRVDAAVTGLELGRLTLEQAGCQHQVMATVAPFTSGDLHLFVSHHSPLMAHLPQLQQFFRERHKPADIDAMNARHRAAYIKESSEGLARQPTTTCLMQ